MHRLGTRAGVISALTITTFAFAACKQSEQKQETKKDEKAATAAVPQGKGADGKETLAVGFLPVTCHLTCPVTDFASRTSTIAHFESQRFTDFPTVVETIKSGRLDATFMILPLAMKLRAQGLPVKILYLGHRDGSTIMVKKDSTAKTLSDLKGKTFAIPSRFSNQNIVIHALMEKEGLKDDDFKFVELPPPDMPTALASNAIDAYFVGEPHAAKAEVDGTGRVLFHAKDIWPNFISCGLVVTERLIKERPQVVRELVKGIAESGQWAETHREDAAKVAAPYFKQPQKLLTYVLTTPADRVRYVGLKPTLEELQKIADYAEKLKIFDKHVDISQMLDLSFVPETIKDAKVDPTLVTENFKP